MNATSKPVPTEPIRKPVTPKLPLPDALLRFQPDNTFSSLTTSWDETRTAWLARIEQDRCEDAELTYWRTPTAYSATGLFLSPTDGGLSRGGGTSNITPHAWRQLVNLLNNSPTAPRSPADAFGWLTPPIRAQAFAELRDRSTRKEGPGHELLMRFFNYQGRRTLRAVVSARHSGIHFDDVALVKFLDETLTKSDATFVSRGVDFTHGYAVMGSQNSDGKPETAARLALSFSNSETGAASLGFAGACHVRAINAQLRCTVDIVNAKGRTRRSHTLPRARRSEEERAAIGQERLTGDIAEALTASRALAQAWDAALTTYAPGWGPITGQPMNAAPVVLDIIEELTGFESAEERTALEAVLTSGALDSLPTLTAAHVAGAFAVLASNSTSWSEAHRLQGIAARWVLKGFEK